MAEPANTEPAFDMIETSHPLATTASHASFALPQFTASRAGSSDASYSADSRPQQIPDRGGTASYQVTADVFQASDTSAHGHSTAAHPLDDPGHTMREPVQAVFPNLMTGSHGSAAPNASASAFSNASRTMSMSKADLQATLASNLAPQSGHLLSQRPDGSGLLSPVSTSQDVLATPSSAFPVFGNSTEKPEKLDQAQPISTETNPGQANGIRYLPYLPPGSSNVFSHTPPSSRKQHSYVLPDGTVLNSGKGLGRGRPGIPRGPRKSKLATEITPEITPTPDAATSTSSIDDKKRKHMKDPAQTPPLRAEPFSRSTSPEFIPHATETRSGRQTQKPVPQVSQSASPASKKPKLDEPNSAKKGLAFAKIKRKIYRGREHSALCEHCLRGHGPPSNVIVFCDACNKCWHQRCHDPLIPTELVKDSKAEWFCSACDKIINGAKKSKKKSAPTLKLPPPLPVPMVGASILSREQRQSQLANTSKDQLIALLLHASDLAPHLPLFEDPTWDKDAVATPTKTIATNEGYPTPTQEIPGSQSRRDVEEAEYEYFLDEHAALYPKPGNGVKLPPESKDLHILLEGPECQTFSHKIYARHLDGQSGL